MMGEKGETSALGNYKSNIRAKLFLMLFQFDEKRDAVKCRQNRRVVRQNRRIRGFSFSRQVEIFGDIIYRDAISM